MCRADPCFGNLNAKPRVWVQSPEFQVVLVAENGFSGQQHPDPKTPAIITIYAKRPAEIEMVHAVAYQVVTATIR